MKFKSKKMLSLVAAAAFAVGAIAPAIATTSFGPQSTDYGNWYECIKHCAGSCTMSGRCFLIER